MHNKSENWENNLKLCLIKLHYREYGNQIISQILVKKY